jgi:hypothetical protein
MMRRALTLVELLYTMVLIALVFTVLPKILFVGNKAAQTSLKEDGLFMAYTAAVQIASLPWDQHTLDLEGKILHTDGVVCGDGTGPDGEDGYRIGGFPALDARNCLGYDGTALWKPSHGREGNATDDLDDFDGWRERTRQGRVAYDLSARVAPADGDMKKLVVEVNASAGKLGTEFRSHFFFRAYNLGWVRVNRRAW